MVFSSITCHLFPEFVKLTAVYFSAAGIKALCGCPAENVVQFGIDMRGNETYRCRRIAGLGIETLRRISSFSQKL
jgi:hypothetical protein